MDANLRRALYKTIEDTKSTTAYKLQLIAFDIVDYNFAADLFIEVDDGANVDSFVLYLNSDNKYSVNLIQNASGDTYYFTVNGGSVHLRTSDTVNGFVNIAVRKEVKYGVVNDPTMFASVLADGLINIQVDDTHTTQTESLKVDGISEFTGNVTLAADLAVNGGDITSSAATLNIGASNIINIGETLKATTILGTLNVDEAVTFDSTLLVADDTTLTGDLAVNGGDITSSAATLNIGLANIINIGQTSKATTIKGTLNVDEAATFDTTAEITGSLTVNNGASISIDVAEGLISPLVVDLANTDTWASSIAEFKYAGTTEVTIGPGSVAGGGAINVDTIQSNSNLNGYLKLNDDTTSLRIPGDILFADDDQKLMLYGATSYIKYNEWINDTSSVDTQISSTSGGDINMNINGVKKINISNLGVGIGGVDSTGEGLKVNGTVYFNNDLKIDGTLNVNDIVTVNKTSGDIVTTGDIAVNGGDITSSAETLNIGLANIINIGETLKMTSVLGTLDVAEAMTTSTINAMTLDTDELSGAGASFALLNKDIEDENYELNFGVSQIIATAGQTPLHTINIGISKPANADTEVDADSIVRTINVGNAKSYVNIPGNLTIDGENLTLSGTVTQEASLITADYIDNTITPLSIVDHNGGAADVTLFEVDYLGNTEMLGELSVISGDIKTSHTTFNIGNPATTDQTLNLGTAVTGAEETKIVNLGTGGAVGSITNINIGSSVNGTTTISSPTTVISGNLRIDGTTTTANSTTITVDDPIITLGGDTAPISDDDKDRGVEFRYYNAEAARLGFMGWDDSSLGFTLLKDATNTAEVFSGTLADLSVGAINGVTLAGDSTITANVNLTIGSDTTYTGYITIRSNDDTARTLTLGSNSTLNALTLGHILYASAANTVSGKDHLDVSDGGTGLATLTNGQLLVGAGTSDVTFQTFDTANIESAIVQRDESGDFAAHDITANDITANAINATAVPYATSTVRGAARIEVIGDTVYFWTTD